VKVAVANAGSGNPHQHFRSPRRRRRAFFEDQGLPPISNLIASHSYLPNVLGRKKQLAWKLYLFTSISNAAYQQKRRGFVRPYQALFFSMLSGFLAIGLFDRAAGFLP